MARISWDDLPPEVRDRIRGARTEERRRRVAGEPGPKVWRCCTCGEESASYAAAERHADATGHARIEIPLGP